MSENNGDNLWKGTIVYILFYNKNPNFGDICLWISRGSDGKYCQAENTGGFMRCLSEGITVYKCI